MDNEPIDVRERLGGLVGHTIHTISGTPNRVLGVQGDDVVVATGKSPHGEPVPIEWVENAVRLLEREGEVRINPATIGYRSAFIGAFLLTLPGATGVRNPARVRIETLRRAPNYWTFRTSPDVFDVETALAEAETCLWTTKGKRVRKGDRVAIWKLKARTATHGVVALAEVLTDPVVQADETPYWLDREAAAKLEERVLGRFVIPPYLPIWMPHPVLDDLNAAKAHGGAVFHMTETEWSTLVDAAGGWPTGEVQDAILELARIAGRTTRGQGFSANQQVKKAVELHAMKAATAHYEADGWQVEDVSATQSFDLRCRRGGEEIHVEVKGTTSSGEEVIVTPNEVRHARSFPRSTLFVMYEIGVSPGSSPTTAHGRVRIIDPWLAEEDRLRPVGYTFSVPAGAE